MKKIIFAILSLSFLFAQVNWKLDKSHSKIGFSVKHLVITDVEGSFDKYDGTVITKDDKFENPQISFTLDANSINTQNEGRDKHLKNEDFFDVGKYPEIKFVGKSYKKISNDKYELIGDLTIKNITKQVKFDVINNGTIKDFRGNTRTGFKITTEINRFDFDLKWNSMIEVGPVVGKNVQIIVNLQLIKE